MPTARSRRLRKLFLQLFGAAVVALFAVYLRMQIYHSHPEVERVVYAIAGLAAIIWAVEWAVYELNATSRSD